MADKDQLIAGGFQAFNQGLGEGLQKFVQNKRESEFLDGAFEMLVSQRKKLGGEIDPNILQKFSSGGLGSRRAIVSQLGAENQQAVKSQSSRESSMLDLQNQMFMESVKQRGRENLKKVERDAELEQNILDSKAYELITGQQLPAGSNPNVAINAMNAKKESKPDMLETWEAIQSFSPKEKEEFVNFAQSMKGKGISMSFNPETGQFSFNTGGPGSDLTTSNRSSLQRTLITSEPVANRLAFVLNNSKPTDFGVPGFLGGLVDKASGQIPGLEFFGDPRRIDVQSTLDQLNLDAVKLSDSLEGQLNREEIKLLKAELPAKGDGAQVAIGKLQNFLKKARNDVRSMTEKTGTQLPIWVMSAEELIGSEHSKADKRNALRSFYPSDYQRLMELQGMKSIKDGGEDNQPLPPVLPENTVDRILELEAPDNELKSPDNKPLR